MPSVYEIEVFRMFSDVCSPNKQANIGAQYSVCKYAIFQKITQ